MDYESVSRDCVPVAGNLTVVNTAVSESGGWSHSQTGAVVGGVVVGLAALGVGVAGVVIYSKQLAGKTAISTLQSTATGFRFWRRLLFVVHLCANLLEGSHLCKQACVCVI